MTHNLETRETAFTDAEFRTLDRYADGGIVELGLAACWVTDKQRAKLTGDDQSRMGDHDEEMSFLLADAMVEFGGY